MLNRWLGILTCCGMLVANFLLVQRDLVPRWFAGDPPTPRAFNTTGSLDKTTQTGIFDREGRRLGFVWTEIKRSKLDLIRYDIDCLLFALQLPGAMLPTARFEMQMRYVVDEQGKRPRLDELSVKVTGFDARIELKGEHIPPDDFPCTWQFDTQRGSFVLPEHATRSLNHAFRPFHDLTELYVGQSWRVDLINPLAGAVPGANIHQLIHDDALVEVKRQEQLQHHGKTYVTHVIESGKVRAWVALDGSVLRQTLELPLFGQLVMLDEPYDKVQRDAATSDFLKAQSEKTDRD